MPPISVDRRTAGLTETASTFTRVSSASGAAAEHLASNGEPLDGGMPDEDPYQDPPEPGYAAVFAEDVEREVRRIRVREQARALIDAERRGPLPPFDAGSLRDILARPRPPQARVDGLFPWEASTLILAQRKAGKTTLLLNLSRSLLTGEAFLGTFELQPVDGLVALLNYEAAGDTITQWAAEAGLDPDRFLIVNLRGRRNPLADPEDRGRLAELLRQRSTESLLVDPFGRAYTGQSQNDSGEVGGWLIELDRSTRNEIGGRDLILTTHAGWNHERTRGSSALED
jgi:AAA domain